MEVLGALLGAGQRRGQGVHLEFVQGMLSQNIGREGKLVSPSFDDVPTTSEDSTMEISW